MTVVRILTDYIRYLNKCTKEYIEQTHSHNVLDYFGDEVMYVMTHPNGWGGPQQTQLREAAVHADLVSDTDEGRARVCFVTEGEASLHYCLACGLQIEGSVSQHFFL